jgi:hypothetical protein
MIFSVYGTNLVGITFTIAMILLKKCSCKENYREFSSYNHVIHRRIIVFLGLLNCHSLHVEAQVLRFPDRIALLKVWDREKVSFCLR